MTRLYAILAAIGGAIVAALAFLKMGEVSADNRRDARDAKANLDAEINRRKLDDEIDQDTDLAARARRSGLVRGE